MTIRLPEVTFPTTSPSQQEQEVAKVSARQIGEFLTKGKRKPDLKFELGEETVSIPRSAADMLHQILSQMAQGNAITLIPSHAELTTQDAADALNVSRPYLIKLLDGKKLPFRKVGTHRRILFSDLMAYKQTAKEARLKVLEELQKQAQEEDLGY